MTSSTSRWLLLIASVALFGGLTIWVLVLRTPDAPPPPGRGDWRTETTPVSVVEARPEPLAVQIKALGTVTPLNTVTVRSRVDGELVRVAFQEGEYVKAGQLLAEIDPRAYKVQLAQAEAQHQQNLAQLQNAESDLERYRSLSERQQVSGQMLDAQRAMVRQYEGTVKFSQAQVDDARLQLSYTRITAPISGRLGLRRVDAGNLISSGDVDGLVVITQMQPMSVLFTVPETQLDDVLTPLRDGQSLPVEAWDRGERARVGSGTLKTIDNQIDTATGTLRLRAEFANEEERMFPNQFVNVRLFVREVEGAVTIPVDTVQHGSRGPFVYVVTAQNTVNQRYLQLGPSADGRVSVTDGLAVGEKVVLEGIDRLRDGREVEVLPGTPREDGPPTQPDARPAPDA
jgi:membrane fusion protein, multidrug efflux system